MFPGKLFLTVFSNIQRKKLFFFTWNMKFHFFFDIAAGMFATYSALVALKLKTSIVSSTGNEMAALASKFNSLSSTVVPQR